MVEKLMGVLLQICGWPATYYTTGAQLLHNSKTHWGGTHIIDLTPMYLRVV